MNASPMIVHFLTLPANFMPISWLSIGTIVQLHALDFKHHS